MRIYFALPFRLVGVFTPRQSLTWNAAACFIPGPMKRSTWLRSAFTVLPAGIVMAACGSRGPLDDDVEVVYLVADAGQDVTAAADVGAGADTGGGTPDSSSSTDAQADTGRRMPPPGMDGGIIDIDTGIPVLNCGLCVVQQCGSQVLGCIESPTCQTTLQCVATMCLAGGTPSPTCILQCGGDAATLLQLVQIFTCITGSCGTSCLSLVGGLGGGGGGLPGGGGGGGGPGGGGGGPGGGGPGGGFPITPGRRAVINEAFSAWPQLCIEEPRSESAE